jgi:hypothetical protein
MPARFQIGFDIQRGVDEGSYELREMGWGIGNADDGEFICPDTFGQHPIIPVTTNICLRGKQPDSVISKSEVATMNRLALQTSKRYCFARNFSACPV